MKKYMRILAIVLVCLLMGGMFLGCAEKPQGADGQTTSSSSATTTSGTGSTVQSGETTTTQSGDKADGTTGKTTTTTKSDVTVPTQAKDPRFPGCATDLKGRVIRINMPPNMSTDPNNESVKRRNQLVAEIEKTYNCKIEFYVRYSENGGDTTITRSVLSGNPVCDVWIQSGASEFMAHYEAGLLQDLSKMKVVDFERTNNPWSESIDLYKMNGSYYALTDIRAIDANYASSSYVMYYNPTLLRQYGITEDLHALQESGKWTWAKFAEICKKFNSNAPDNMAAFYDFDLDLYHSLLYTNGTDWIKNSGSSLTFNGNDTKAQEALTQYREWTADGTIKVPSAVTTTSVFQNTQYSFFTGLAPFEIGLVSSLEWGLMQGGVTTQAVKDNYGILMLPKWDESDEYTATVYGSQIGGYAIPYGVKAPNEVLTVMDAFYSYTSNTSGDPTEKYLQSNIDKWLNEKNGTKSRQTIARLHKLFLNGKQSYSDSWIGSYTTPDIRTNVNTGWYAHVLKVANGTEPMGTALSSVTNTYNKALSTLFGGR